MANEQSNPQAKPQPQSIPLAKIHDLPGVFIPKQPDKSYGGLVTSIQASGVKEAVILRLREDGEYQLVTGYRRRRASELAKKQEIPAYVYEMTMQEAIAYHKQVKVQANAPIPGKMVESAVKAPDGPAKPAPTSAPGEKSKEQAEMPAEKHDDPMKITAPATKEEKPIVAAAGTAASSKDKGKTADPAKTGDKPEKPVIPAEKSKTGEKPGEPAKTVIPSAKDEKPAVATTGTTAPAEDKGKTADPAKTGDKSEKPVTPAEKSKTREKPGESAKTVIPSAKDEKPAVATTGATAPAEDKGKTADPTKTGDKLEKPSVPAEKSKTGEKPSDPSKIVIPSTKEDKEKTSVPKAEDKSEKSTKVVDLSAAAGKSVSTAVTGPAASGPTGTAITQIFEERLNPPDENALKSLPVPKEGESFFITLHPAYLQKSKFNTFSVDTNSENFKELRKSVELVGIKDPVLTRINPEGGLEILSGQRRHLAASQLNYSVPAIIQHIDDADAKIIVADGNLHRDKISSYDLSRALRMKMEGMKQKSGRRKKGEIKTEELDSDEKLAREMGMSVSKLNRIIRLSEASKDVCDRVDDGSLALSIASAISFLKPANQDEVLHLADLGYKVTNDRVERMKKVEKSGKLDELKMREILEDKDIAPKKIVPPAPAPIPTPAPTPVPTVSTAPTATPVTPTSVASTPTASAAPAATTIPASPDVKPTVPPINEPAQAGPAETPTPVVPAGEKAPDKDHDIFKGPQERPESTKIILTGDRLRRYFPDVNMTPREIEDSIYEALEERRQRQAKMQQKKEIFQKSGPAR